MLEGGGASFTVLITFHLKRRLSLSYSSVFGINPAEFVMLFSFTSLPECWEKEREPQCSGILNLCNVSLRKRGPVLHYLECI